MYKRFFLILALCLLFISSLYSQDIENIQNKDKEQFVGYKIENVEYKITGFTKEAPLRSKILIDQKRIFLSKEELDKYITELDTEFKNLRNIEQHNIDLVFFEPKENIIPVNLIIDVKDTWNIIAIPYPSFDSNKGLEFKLKLKDFNFLGKLEPLTMDLIYNKDNDDKSSFSLGSHFSLPVYVNPVKFIWHNDLELSADQDKNFNLGFETGLSVLYKFGLDWLTLKAGAAQGIDLLTSPKKINYYFINSFFTSLIFDIYKNPIIGTISWSPYFEINGDWKFQKVTEDKHKGVNIICSHNFEIGKVNWINNFRQGFTVKLDNDYKYNTYRKGNVDVSFGMETKGFYSLVDRLGLYGRFDYFYNLFGKESDDRSGKILRGILNNRISTDTAISFNFDVPVKIGVFKWEEITGIEWTRFFGFELHIAPFLDIALVHDKESGTYYDPKYGWYSGGLEIIMYPVKMRSIYARISYGHDLREIKKRKGYAKRDGRPVSEIFIGIGLHY